MRNLLLSAILLQQPVAPAPAATGTASMLPAYIPERVYDTRRQTFADLESMLADLAKADVVLVGEQHDDPNTHRLEAAILDGLRRRGVPVTLSLEMFERDTQARLDAYLAGTVIEKDFLETSRPWPRYATDYRSLIEMARTEAWAVIAANVPRRFAASVAKDGLGALDGLPAEERTWVAADLRCPRDAYFDRFADSMKAHQPSAGDDPKTTERYYLSQCVKDETMAEAIAAGYERYGRRLVVHISGAFHSDFGLGTAERVRRRLSDRRVAVVSVLPVKDLDAIAPTEDDSRRADYLIYTVAEPKR